MDTVVVTKKNQFSFVEGIAVGSDVKTVRIKLVAKTNQ